MYSSLLLASLLLVAPLMVLSQVDLFILKDPHIRSVANSYEVCNYWSNTWFDCFDSPLFKVACIFSQKSLSGSYIPTSLTAINIKFTNPNAHTTESYTVSDVHIPITFTLDSGSTVVNDDLGNPWLSIAPTTIETVIIQDFNSLSTITISRYPEQLYNLQITTDPTTTAFATGMLVSGCPPGFVYSGRKRRSTSDECKNLSASKYPALNEDVIYEICEHNADFFPNIADEIKKLVKNFDLHKEKHNRVIMYAKEKNAKQIKG